MAKDYRLLYKDAEKTIVFNDKDEDMVPIVYQLPPVPPIDLIPGFGLHPLEQYWEALAPRAPEKLISLDKKRLTRLQKMRELEHNPYYEDCIQFVQQEWKRRKHGFVFYNKGRPVQITGPNYYYLKYWPIEGRLPMFKMRDRKWWWFEKMCEDDINCTGFNYPKHRREGATTRASCAKFEIVSRTPYAHGALQSKTEKDASDVTEFHIKEPWSSIPFWFQPVWDGDERSIRRISFTAPPYKTAEEREESDLRSYLTFEDSGVKAYDGKKIRILHNDEIGKIDNIDVHERWKVQELCLKVGNDIVGKAINTSTVDKMTKIAAQKFKQLCDESDYHKRSANNRTETGLFTLFIPASDGYEGNDPLTGLPLTDKYGHTNIKRAEEIILSERESYRVAGKMDAWVQAVRQLPLRYRDCFKAESQNCNFNLYIIEQTLERFRHGNPFKQRGDFRWKDGVIDGRVEFVPCINGKFEVSYLFKDDKYSNSCYLMDGKKYPGNVAKFCAGGDPYRFKLTKYGKRSMGAGTVFYKFDSTVDGGKPVDQWASERFVCTYSNRPPDPDIYCEDMLMMCIYFGCEMNPEANIDMIERYFLRRGYAGYLYYKIDAKHRMALQAGEHTGEKSKEDIFAAWQLHIEKNGLREVHTELLEQCREIDDDMGAYDLFAAGGKALTSSRRFVFSNNDDAHATDINDYIDFNTYDYA